MKFKIRKLNNIGSDTKPIRDFLPEKIFEKYRVSLSKYDVFYIDQLTTITGTYIINKQDLWYRNFSKNKTYKMPKWYNT